MFRFLALLLLFPLISTSLATEHISDQYRFAISLPDTESWVNGSIQRLGRDAEIVFSSVNMESREAALVTIIPKIPSENIMNQAVIGRVIEVLTMQGFSVLSHAPKTVNGVEFLELIGRRTDETNAKIISVSRAAFRDGTVYLVTGFGRGNEDRVPDARFLRVIDTFRFLEDQKIIGSPLTDPMHGYYRASYLACLGAAAALTLLFSVVLFPTRKRAFT